MVRSDAQSVEQYIEDLPEDRRQAISALRQVILANLPEGYQEMMLYGGISYVVPLSEYPDTYNGQPLAYVSLASQKNYISVYLMGCYGNPAAEAWFKEEYAKTGKALDMGKSCVRFKRLEDIPLDLIGQAVALETPAAFVRRYELARATR